MFTQTKVNRRSRIASSAKAEDKRSRRAEFGQSRTQRAEFVDDRTAISESMETMLDSMHRGEILFVQVGCAPLAGEKREIPQEPPADSPDWDDDEAQEFAAQEYL